MKILLLQDDIHLSSFGGGTKANRLLLEELAQNGHDCALICPALTKSGDGPNNQLEFMQQMACRRIIVRGHEPHVFSYSYDNVQVDAIIDTTPEQNRAYIERRITAFQPEWILVTEDKQRYMLEAATNVAPDRILLVFQTIVQLPFGPLSVQESPRQTELIVRARGICAISDFLRQYIAEHAGLESHLMHLPVYGKGPFPPVGRPDNGFITMINPSELKGLSIFLALAREFPQFQFAAVPTWGADENVLKALGEVANINILAASEDIDEIYSQTRILLVPSLWPETFGYVVVEAMLRGIPVLASDIGGISEAKLGVDYLLPVQPAQKRDGSYVAPPQEIGPWSRALSELLSRDAVYNHCAKDSQEAAQKFVSGVDVSVFENLLVQLKHGRQRRNPSDLQQPSNESRWTA